MRTRGIDWGNVEYNILRKFEGMAETLYECKNSHKVYWPEYHYVFAGQQLLAEFKGWA